MDGITGETRDQLLTNYSQEADLEVFKFQLMALKPAPSTVEDYERADETLSNLITTYAHFSYGCGTSIRTFANPHFPHFHSRYYFTHHIQVDITTSFSHRVVGSFSRTKITKFHH